MLEAKITDSVSMKAIILLWEGRVIYPDNLNYNKESITVDVYGEHSGSLVDPTNMEVPYYVTLRKNGTLACTCENSLQARSNEYKHFWGEIPIRAKPECSHALAAKLHPLYFQWLSNGTVEKKKTNVRCKIRSGKIKLSPKYTTSINQIRTRRNVNLSDLIKNRKEIE
jgi:hypothetical protein